MNKTALISWMGFIEAAVRVASRSGPDESLKRAAEARETFAADAACASVKDPSNTPPLSSWPSVARTRKETRAEAVAEIHRVLNDAKTAEVIDNALRRSRDNYTVTDVLVCASAYIAGHMGKSE